MTWKPILERLVGFDTTSRNSNLELIGYVEEYLAGLGIASERVEDRGARKASLFATIGPADRPGIALSGHTDVVPVDGQDWSSDPFTLTEREGRLHGRGTADMKGFIALCLAGLPELLSRPIETPIHLALSYDEEVGCRGVRPLLAELARRPVRPRGCIIGEPTGMGVIRAHKGKLATRVVVRGRASHSGLAHQGVNAVEAAAEAVAWLKALARRLRDEGPFDPELDPPWTTVHVGTIRGGTALNIVPEQCVFELEIRHLPEVEPDALMGAFEAHLRQVLEPEMKAVDGKAGFRLEPVSRVPGLAAAPDEPIVTLALALTGANETGKVSFGTEGGLFQEAGIPAVVCGPGHIEQAHKADEFVSLGQLERCRQFLTRLFARCHGQG